MNLWRNGPRPSSVPADSSISPTREVRPRARTHSWWPYVDGLLSRTRETAHLFLNQEQTHVLRQVRPRLSLLDQHRDNNNRLNLRLRMTGEGSWHLDDVTILLNAGGPSGLLPPRLPGEAPGCPHLSGSFSGQGSGALGLSKARSGFGTDSGHRPGRYGLLIAGGLVLSRAGAGIPRIGDLDLARRLTPDL